MDARNNMIIAKDKIITSDVVSCQFDAVTEKWDVVFHNGKKFSYAKQNVTWLKNPVSLNPLSYRITSRGKLFDNITSIHSFKDGFNEYWHICFSNDYENDYRRSDLEVVQSCLDNERAKKIFAYLKEVAKNVSVKTEDDTAILEKQYDKIDFLGENSAVAAYLNPEEYESGTDLEPTPLIFPFGCNESQYKAVKQAITNRLSVIEGPPGTGKTQTILNIIANLFIRDKTIQVVSNNNSAIENVIEKLASPKYQMDFIVASLGRMEKKEAFIAAQTGRYPDISAWGNAAVKSDEEITNLGVKLQGIFKKQNRQAELISQRKEIVLEQRHFSKTYKKEKLLSVPELDKLNSLGLLQLQQEIEAYAGGEIRYGFFRKLAFRFNYGFSFRAIEKYDVRLLLLTIQSEYYKDALSEIDDELEELKAALKDVNAKALTEELTHESLTYFQKRLYDKYGEQDQRRIFEADDLWKNSNEFIREYPVVLSTTYTARSSLGKNAIFDFVIMDEASQVDVATGALAISCARNAVIVGDDKQLPNVVTTEQKKTLSEIFQRYKEKDKIPDAYDFTAFSFLKSIYTLFGKRIPKTILSEHYRCDPQIIGYCNQKFYKNGLVVLTQEHKDPLNLVLTVAGNHKREQANLRQAEVIRDEILPQIDADAKEIGIITPYRHQVELLKQTINNPDIDIATVHKFQGREKDVIIFCTVDDIVTAFSDDANLLNVAISRAKKQLYLVASEMDQPVGSNVGDLIGYIRYNNCTEFHSKISSVFDYLYQANEKERLEFLKSHKKISEFDSENLFYALIKKVLDGRKEALGVICHLPLYSLIRDYSLLTDEELKFVNTGLSHLDFVIYNKVTKMPLLAVEVDGYNYHKADSRQGERDQLKNHIMEVYELPLLRFSTNGSREREQLQTALDGICFKAYQ